MTKPFDPQAINAIIDGKSCEIEAVNEALIMEIVGVAMSIDKLQDALNSLQAHLDQREFEKASSVGYNELAENFVYVQRTLAGLQAAAYRKESLISSVALEARTAYENVAPYVEKRMASASPRKTAK